MKNKNNLRPKLKCYAIQTFINGETQQAIVLILLILILTRRVHAFTRAT